MFTDITYFDFKRNTEKVIDSLVYDYNISRREIFNGTQKNSLVALSATDMNIISRNLNANFINIAKGRVSIESIANYILYPSMGPSHFKGAAFSSTTSFNSLSFYASFVEDQEFLNRELQISPMYTSKAQPLSVLACRNGLEAISKKISKREVEEIGKLNAQKFINSDFGMTLKKCTSFECLVTCFFHHVDMVEKNWSYTIVSKHFNSFVINSHESEELIDSMGEAGFSTNLLNIWRWSFLSEVLNHFSSGIVQCNQLTDDNQDTLVSIEMLQTH